MVNGQVPPNSSLLSYDSYQSGRELPHRSSQTPLIGVIDRGQRAHHPSHGQFRCLSSWTRDCCGMVSFQTHNLLTTGLKTFLLRHSGATERLNTFLKCFVVHYGMGLYICGPPRQPSGEQETWPTWEVRDWWKTYTWRCLRHKRCLLDSSALYHRSTRPVEEISRLVQ